MGLVGKKETDYRRAALDMYLDNTYNPGEDQFAHSLWSSWGVGAYALLESLNEIPGHEMTPDNLEKAKLLLEVGIQPMISIWYHNWESQESHSDEEKAEAREIAFANVQAFLCVTSEDRLRLYLGFDRELQCYHKGERNSPGYYVDMFYQRCSECITGEQIADWGKLKFPIDSDQQFRDACYTNKHVYWERLNLLQGWVAIGNAAVVMFDEFRRVYKKNKES